MCGINVYVLPTAIQFASASTTKSMLTLVDNVKVLTDMITAGLDYPYTCTANLL